MFLPRDSIFRKLVGIKILDILEKIGRESFTLVCFTLLLLATLPGLTETDQGGHRSWKWRNHQLGDEGGEDGGDVDETVEDDEDGDGGDNEDWD